VIVTLCGPLPTAIVPCFCSGLVVRVATVPLPLLAT
jgi:hypothetical protein